MSYKQIILGPFSCEIYSLKTKIHTKLKVLIGQENKNT